MALGSSGTAVAVELYEPYGSLNYPGERCPRTTTIPISCSIVRWGCCTVGRWYDPLADQFTSADSVQGDPCGMNPYGYVGGNPETFVDPTGQRIADICDEDPEDCDTNANSRENQGTIGPYRGPSNGLPPDEGSIPAGAVVEIPLTIDVTIGDTQYLYTPDDGNIIVQGPDGEPQYLTPADGEAYYRALNDITEGINAEANAGDQATTPQQALAEGDTGGGSTTITAVTSDDTTSAPADTTASSTTTSSATTSTNTAKLSSINGIFNDPSSVQNMTPQEVSQLAQNDDSWEEGQLGRGAHAGQGYTLRERNASGNLTGRYLQWHPGGGQHGPLPYWKVSSPQTGIQKFFQIIEGLLGE